MFRRIISLLILKMFGGKKNAALSHSPTDRFIHIAVILSVAHYKLLMNLRSLSSQYVLVKPIRMFYLKCLRVVNETEVKVLFAGSAKYCGSKKI